MANTVIIPLPPGHKQDQVPVPVQGDGVALTTSINLSLFGIPGTPFSVTLFSALDANGSNVASHVVSSVISGNFINVTFTATFSTLYQLIYTVESAQVAPPALPISGVVTANQGTNPWTVGGTVAVTQSTSPWVASTVPGARTAVTLFYDAGALTVAEGLITMGITKGGVSLTAATSYTVSVGKTLWIQSIAADVRSTSASPNARVRLRTAPSAIGIASPIIGAWEFFPQGNGQLDRLTQSFNNLGIAGGTQIAVSQIASAATPVLTMTIVGFES